VSLYDKIRTLQDADLTALLAERDALAMDADCGREIRAEWAQEARDILDKIGMPAGHEDHRCDCNICAITHGLASAHALLTIERTEAT
jgi:hypothetical protein